MTRRVLHASHVEGAWPRFVIWMRQVLCRTSATMWNSVLVCATTVRMMTGDLTTTQLLLMLLQASRRNLPALACADATRSTPLGVVLASQWPEDAERVHY